jgi:hypothetical protein
MKKPLLVFLFLLAMGAYARLQAQTKPAKAPVKKTVQKAPASATPATNRSNSPALPKATPVAQPAPPPQKPSPPPAQRPSASHSSRRRSSNSGGLGYEKGDNLLNIGVGLSSYYYGNPIGLSYEAGIDKDFSVGAQLDYNSGNYGDYYYNSSRWRYTATYFGLRASYHFNRVLKLNTSKVDLYAGLGLGYRSFRWNDSNYGSGYDYRSGLFFNYFVGGKYYFTDKVGGFLELGYTGLSSSRVGITIKF